jgi:hypothetical protein
MGSVRGTSAVSAGSCSASSVSPAPTQGLAARDFRGLKPPGSDRVILADHGHRRAILQRQGPARDLPQTSSQRPISEAPRSISRLVGPNRPLHHRLESGLQDHQRLSGRPGAIRWSRESRTPLVEWEPDAARATRCLHTHRRSALGSGSAGRRKQRTLDNTAVPWGNVGGDPGERLAG